MVNLTSMNDCDIMYTHDAVTGPITNFIGSFCDGLTVPAETDPVNKKDYSHYYKPCPYSYVDVYRVLSMFNITDPCLQHAIKKLLVAGGRGVKDIGKDVDEAIASLRRWEEMQYEDGSHSKYYNGVMNETIE